MDTHAPLQALSEDDNEVGAYPSARQPSPAARACWRRKNQMHSAGGKALVIGLAWRSAEASKRGPLIAALGKAFKQMLDEGIEPPSARQLAAALEAVSTRTKRASTGRSRRRKT